MNRSLINRSKRIVSRVAGLALVLSGVALVLAGPASANDRAIAILCTDHTTGAWEVSVTFSSIEVKADRPVTVTLGRAQAVLTAVGPDGTVTLHQDFPGSKTSAEVIWSVVRLDYQNMGKLHLTQPAGCRDTTTSTTMVPPTTAGTVPAPPTSAAPPTTHAVKAPAAPTTTITPQVEAAHIGATLPVTGGVSVPLVALGALSVLGGLVLVRSSRRRASTPA
jgi:hypothetical protein